ncbi:MAG: condensation domain-containing protein [Chloroflexota bacterium]
MRIENIEDIYPLSPMQQGILFHHLLAPDAMLFTLQFNCVLHGPLESSALQQAWQQTIVQNSILRTAFYWEKLHQPMQVVRQQATLPWHLADWRTLNTQQQKSELAALRKRDAATAFDLAQAPLMRIHLIRTEEETHHLIWSYHHLLLDGWSTSLVLNEVWTRYQTITAADGFTVSPDQDAEVHLPAIPTRPPYQRYVAWLQNQETTDAEAYWQTTLQGVKEPTSLGFGQPATNKRGGQFTYAEERFVLDQVTTDKLNQSARDHGLTLNTFCQAAWAILLSQLSGQSDLLLGITVSGREAELSQIDQMFGVFINALPMRVQIPNQTSVLDWLRQIQEQAFAMRRYEHVPQHQIQKWSAIPQGTPLFESVFIFVNYPMDGANAGANLHIDEIEFVEQTNTPLTIAAYPEDGLHFLLNYQEQRFDAQEIVQVGEKLCAQLTAIVDNLAASVDTLVDKQDSPSAASVTRAEPEIVIEAKIVAPLDLINDFNTVLG